MRRRGFIAMLGRAVARPLSALVGRPPDVTARKALYERFDSIVLQDLPIIYLYHMKWIWGMPAKLAGFTPYPDGMIRLEGVKLTQ